MSKLQISWQISLSKWIFQGTLRLQQPLTRVAPNPSKGRAWYNHDGSSFFLNLQVYYTYSRPRRKRSGEETSRPMRTEYRAGAQQACRQKGATTSRAFFPAVSSVILRGFHCQLLLDNYRKNVYCRFHLWNPYLFFLFLVLFFFSPRYFIGR